MFSSPYLMILLLANIVQMVSTVPPEGCDMNKKPEVEKLDLSRLAGTWYMKAVSSNIPCLANLTSYVTNVTISHTGFDTVLVFTNKPSYKNGANECQEINLSCTLQGSECTSKEFPHLIRIIAIDYESVLASLSETYLNGEVHFSLGLYTREAFSKPDVSSIMSTLQEFCGAPAADPTSSFYNVKLFKSADRLFKSTDRLFKSTDRLFTSADRSLTALPQIIWRNIKGGLKIILKIIPY